MSKELILEAVKDRFFRKIGRNKTLTPVAKTEVRSTFSEVMLDVLLNGSNPITAPLRNRRKHKRAKTATEANKSM